MKGLAYASVVVAMVAGQASAHHSTAMFDSNKLVIVRGTLISFTNMNPHAWISVLGSVEGRTDAERWDVEATAPSSLARDGISPDTIKAGDKLTVALRPLRDGRRGGAMVFVVTSDGVAHGADPKDLGLDLAALKP